LNKIGIVSLDKNGEIRVIIVGFYLIGYIGKQFAKQEFVFCVTINQAHV